MSLLASFRNPVKPILVVGDVMLDRFNYGVLADHNPESDADSFNINKVEYRAGGAANVALNLRALGAPVILGGIVGNDSEGSQLQALLQQHDVQTLFTSDGRQTTVKTRHIFENTGQHKLRSNYESKADISHDVADQFIHEHSHLLEGGISAIAFSDYAKGFLTEYLTQTLIALARHQQIPILVDTKPEKLSRYTGSTVLKPNRREAQHMVNVHLDGCLPNYRHPTIVDFCQRLRQHTGTEYVFVTCGEEGILAIDPENTISYAPALPCEHPDVTGAGDTIMALLTLGFAHHGKEVPVQELLHIANAGGHIVVNKRGTSTATLDEITAVLAKRF